MGRGANRPDRGGVDVAGEPVPPLPPTAMSADALRAAEIPVERINGPVLLIGADGDRVWPSSFLSRIAWDRLQREGHAWPDQFLRYPGAGHGIGMPHVLR